MGIGQNRFRKFHNVSLGFGSCADCEYFASALMWPSVADWHIHGCALTMSIFGGVSTQKCPDHKKRTQKEKDYE